MAQLVEFLYRRSWVRSLEGFYNFSPESALKMQKLSAINAYKIYQGRGICQFVTLVLRSALQRTRLFTIWFVTNWTYIPRYLNYSIRTFCKPSSFCWDSLQYVLCSSKIYISYILSEYKWIWDIVSKEYIGVRKGKVYWRKNPYRWNSIQSIQGKDYSIYYMSNTLLKRKWSKAGLSRYFTE